MSTIRQFFYAASVALTLLAGPAHAGLEDDVARLQQDWARIKYQSPATVQEQQFAQLTSAADKVVAQYPQRAEALIWQGIIESTYAGAKGGLGALSHAKNARKSFEQALAINPQALDGSAYTSLGTLYSQVPGWPIGFGDDKKALELLKKGLAAHPDGIDPNYFYGDYLLRNGDLDGAERALRKAAQAPARPGRQVADEGRRAEITQLLDKITARRK